MTYFYLRIFLNVDDKISGEVAHWKLIPSCQAITDRALYHPLYYIRSRYDTELWFTSKTFRRPKALFLRLPRHSWNARENKASRLFLYVFTREISLFHKEMICGAGFFTIPNRLHGMPENQWSWWIPRLRFWYNQYWKGSLIDTEIYHCS